MMKVVRPIYRSGDVRTMFQRHILEMKYLAWALINRERLRTPWSPLHPRRKERDTSAYVVQQKLSASPRYPAIFRWLSLLKKENRMNQSRWVSKRGCHETSKPLLCIRTSERFREDGLRNRFWKCKDMALSFCVLTTRNGLFAKQYLGLRKEE